MGLLITFLLGLFIVFGYIIVIISKNTDKFLNFSLALAFGVMLTLGFLEILPEAYMHITVEGNRILEIVILIGSILVGMGMLFLLDKFIPHHHHDHKGKHKLEHNDLKHIGVVTSIALVIHNIIEGMAVYALVKEDLTLGILFAIGVGLHNIPLGMMISSTLVKSKEKKTYLIVFITAISTFVGGLLMMLLNNFISADLIGILLGITLGMVLYIIIFELLHNLLKTKYPLNAFVGIMIGLILFVLTMTFTGHNHMSVDLDRYNHENHIETNTN